MLVTIHILILFSALSWLCAALRHSTEDLSIVDDVRLDGLSASKVEVMLLEIVKQERKIGAKHVTFEEPQPWSHLSEEDAPLVLLCRSIGLTIVPARPEALCTPWRQVPSGQNLLVT